MRRTALLAVMVIMVGASAVPALAFEPAVNPFEGSKIVQCGGTVYEGIGSGTVTAFETPEGSRFVSQSTFHIVWEFVNPDDDTDTFTYVDTGVAQIRDDESVAIHSVSGHTTARPGDWALAYGRWVAEKSGDDFVNWLNHGHSTGCVAV